MDQEIILDTLDATADFAAHLAGILRGGDILALYGDLGAGKTALARLLIQALTNPNMIVPSPTFTLVQEYDSCHQDIKVIRHYDLYRLADESELVELGWDDVGGRDTLTLIEWPERAGGALARHDRILSLFLHHDDGDYPDRRRLRLCGGPEWTIRYQ